MPASPSTDTMDFSSYPYKHKFGFKPLNYNQSLDRKLIMHDPLLFATVNEIYDSMDTTTMTFLNKLFTNAIPYINRIKLYILLAEMFPVLQLEMEAAFLHMKEMPYLERIYNKRIDDNIKHLMYKYRKEIKQNRTDYEETWKKRKERLKAALQGSSKDKNQQDKKELFHADLAQVLVRTHLRSVFGTSKNRFMQKSELKSKKLVEGY